MRRYQRCLEDVVDLFRNAFVETKQGVENGKPFVELPTLELKVTRNGDQFYVNNKEVSWADLKKIAYPN